MNLKLRYTNRFSKSLRKKLNQQEQEAVRKTTKKLQKDPRHPSLRTKKIKGDNSQKVFECSVNMDIRITFHFEKPDTIVLRNCGHHDNPLNNP